MHHREPLPLLYETLFQITAMRDDVDALSGAIEDTDTARFVTRLNTLERQALTLLQIVEADENPVSH